MLGKIRWSKLRWLSPPFRMNKNNVSQVKSSEVKSSQIKSYTHIWETQNGNKGNDYSIIVVIITMINIVIYIDKKEV